MNIDEMQAGREMDALIAGKLGWTELRYEESYILGGCGTGVMPDEVRKNGKGTLLRTLVPDYSTDIAAAWKVVEKMITIHDDLTITYPWCIAMDWRFEYGWGIKASADTAPLAICRAALKALEGGE